MDSDKLVDEIVAQVLGRLGPPEEGRGLRRQAIETGTTATGRLLDDGREHLYGRGGGDGIGRRRLPSGTVTAPSAGDGAPTGLVRPYLASEFSGRRTSFQDRVGWLVVLTAGDGRIEDVHRQLANLASREPLTIYLSPSARKVLDIGALRRACPSAELLSEELTFQMRDLVEAASGLVFPNLTLSTASKIAHLDGDSAASLLAIFALMRAKPVFACTESVFGIRTDYSGVPAGFRSKVDEIFSAIQGLGMQIVALDRLGEIRVAGIAAPRSQVVAADSAHRAAEPAGLPRRSSQTFVDASGVVRTAISTGPCEGEPDKCTGCGQCAEKNEPAVRTLASNGADRIGASLGTKVMDRSIARLIDHTLLKPDATESDIVTLCQEARQYGFASVCINPSYVPLAARQLEGSQVKVCTVIGFPLGATTPTTKAIETRDAIANGANEIDMVINVGALKSGNDDLVRRDIEAVVGAARGQALVKVILETALLSKEEIVKACLLAKMAGADFVKTSTGFGPGGAKVEDVALMRKTVGSAMGVKASGGIRDLETAQAMVEAGATRIGASASVAIAKGESAGAGAY